MDTLPTTLNADRRLAALVHGAQAPWLRSPEPGVERRLLERVGGEVALATSIVRYAPGSRFAAHVHELGEEFLVLEGVFSDEHGDHPAGSYARNPPGSRHAPYSEGGCVIFVKLRQMARDDRDAVRLMGPRAEARLLHEAGNLVVRLEALPPGGRLPLGGATGAQEVFVVEGSAMLHEEGRATPLERWSWLRWPQHGAVHIEAGGDGALLWTARGHLPPARR